MKILGIIPGRGGSKRLPNKNIRPLAGKPLINWTIDTVRGVPDVVDILVSTDSREIASVAKEAGALVPWLRPDELATDTATSVDVCLHALDWYEREKGEVDGLLLLQPTSPFRKAGTIKQGIEIYKSYGGSRPVVALSPADSHPMWCYSLDGDVMNPFIGEADLIVRSQDLPKAYVINGALYLASPKHLREIQSFVVKTTASLLINDPKERVDIDTEWDWMIAEYWLTKIPD